MAASPMRQSIMRFGESATGGHIRRTEVDLLKGCAILWVLLIHSKALGDSLFYLHVVNHAVPLFVILFGLNSCYWWSGRSLSGDATAWYSSRFKRILAPFWAALPVWWGLTLWLRPPEIPLDWWLPLAHLGGYTLHIGTGWFVTLILPLVILFPLLAAAERRFGIWPLLLVAVAGELLVAHWRLDLVERFGFLNFLVFPPRVLAHVVFGIWLARHIERSGGIGPVAGALGALLWALCAAIQQGWLWPTSGPYAETLIDLPLAMTLLAVLRPLAALPLVSPALVWLGLGSWGIYLGQMLMHNAVVYQCGILPDLAPNLAVCHFPFAHGTGNADRWFYTLTLLVGGLGSIWVGNRLLGVHGWLRRRGWPLPELMR